MAQKKEKKLVFNTYLFDFNKKDFITFNIFNSCKFCDDIKKIIKKKEFTKEELRKSLMWCFWSKYEYEVILKEFTGRDNATERKIDVYEQCMLNIDLLYEYILDNWGSVKRGSRKTI